jgi:hypothetical protein
VLGLTPETAAPSNSVSLNRITLSFNDTSHPAIRRQDPVINR